MLRPRVVGIILMPLILSLLFLPACGKAEREESQDSPERETARTAEAVTGGPSVLLVTVDTLRADRLSCYGFTGGTTTAIDGLAAAGTLFEDAVTPVPITLPSHATILTGHYPATLGVRNNGTYRLGQQAVTLAELFKTAGYRTGAFVGAYVLDSVFGLDQGFDVYDDKMPQPRDRAQTERRADQVVSAAVKWLAKKSEKPFFAWIHIWDPHFPYTPPEPMRSAFPDDPYFGEVAFVDTQMRLLFTSLEALGFKGDNLLTVFTADHGEGLHEHGEESHGVFVYDSTLSVPLIMRMGTRVPAGLRVPHMVRTLDIAPTLLELVGLEAPAEMEGVSLVPLLAAGPENQPPPDPGLECHIESLYGQENYGWSPLFGIRTGREKYIHAPEQEFYRLDLDHDELGNRFRAEPDAAAQLVSAFEALSARLEGGETLSDPEWAPAQTVTDKLEQLGYLWAQPSTRGKPDGESVGPDPKIMVRWDARRTEGHKLVRKEGRIDEGLRILREVAAGDPANAMVWENITEGEIAGGNAEAALAAAERGLAIRPRNPNLNVYKGTLLIQLGRADEAVAHFEGLLESHPLRAAIHYHLGEAHSSAGRKQEALNHYNEAEKHGMRTPMVPFQRGMNLYQAGRHGEAVEAFREAVQLKPDLAEAWLNIGVNSFRLNRHEEANEAYMKAIELAPDNAMFRATYGYFLTQTRQNDEARLQLEKALALDPQSVWVHTNLAWYFCKGDSGVRDTDKALRHSARAMELAGINPPANVLNTRAEALSAGGQYDEALEINARLRAAQPDDPYFKSQTRRFQGARSTASAQQERQRQEKSSVVEQP